MPRHHPDGYYWLKEFEHIGWIMVCIQRSHPMAEPMVSFMSRADGTSRSPIPLEKLEGELRGPIPDPSAPNPHS